MAQSGQGQQVGTAAGTAIGTAVGGPLGGAVGGALGGAVGGAIGPEDETAEKAAEAQRTAIANSVMLQLQGINTGRADLSPFTDAGTSALPSILASILGQGSGEQFFDQRQAENQQLQAQKDENDAKRSALQAELDDFRSKTSGGRRSQAKQGIMQEAINAIPEITVPFLGERPDFSSQAQNITQVPTAQGVLDNPFFQALAQEQDQRLINQSAALGKAGSGGTNDALIRQQLLLGNEFQQQERGNRQQDIKNLFGLVQGGQNAAVGQANIATQGAAGLSQSAVDRGDINAGLFTAQNARQQEQTDQLASLLGGLTTNLPLDGIGSFGAQQQSIAPSNVFQQGGAFQNTGNFLGGSGGIFGPTGSFSSGVLRP